MNNKTNNQIASLFSNNLNNLSASQAGKGPISHKKMLELYLKGIKLYDDNLSSFKTNNNGYNKLILSIKKNNLNNLTVSGAAQVPQMEVNNLETVQQKNETNSSVENGAISIRINKYLKAINLLNSKTNGKLINYSSLNSYNFNKANNKLNLVNLKNIYTLLEYSFISMSSLISKPVLEITPEKVVIHLYFFVFNTKSLSSNLSSYSSDNSKDSNSFLIKNSNKLNKILSLLSLYFKKPVELDLVRLHYPYFNNNILVNLLGLIINKIKVRFITKKLFKKAIIKNPTKLNRKNRLTIIPSFLSGIKIRIAGRLLTNRVVPRKTIKTIRRGALARGKVNFLDIARFTNKNKRGAFSITITSGQNFS